MLRADWGPAEPGTASVFENIQQGLSEALRKLRGDTKFTEANMQEGLRAVRRALIEADVNLDVADAFISRVEKAAVEIGRAHV